jgi:predicted MFS family arabinose efflux permease
MEGLIALAIAMGIGRFAFTPILPMMQADAGLTFAQGGWLASANYVGYLVGALAALRLRMRAGTVIRIGLALVGVTTLAMALLHDFTAWVVLRFAAGVASAWVLVFVSSWGFPKPEAVFSGVGTGIAIAGLVCLVLMGLHATSNEAWIVLGAIALVAAGFIWPAFKSTAAQVADGNSEHRWTAESIRLVFCYGAFGFGYIIPATFLPVMARQAIDDPALFGWSWPVFGAAAAASTWLAGLRRRASNDRAVWIGSHIVMAAGVMAPVVWPTFASVVLAGLLVGGTFMVATMVGIQEARRVAGASVRALIAAMTSAFAAGQIAGPVVVSLIDNFTFSLVAAALLLVASALVLWRFP